jgi:2,4-dichlorophenol 6-monooxygenase
VAWRDKQGTPDPKHAEEKLGAAIRAVLDLPSLSGLAREKRAEPAKPGGAPLFA